MKIARKHIVNAIEYTENTGKSRSVFKKYILWVKKFKNGWQINFSDRYRKV